MKYIITILNNMKAAFKRIHLVDRCLLIFMIFLLSQSAISLFFFPADTMEANTIDIIIRTSISAIFGYFLSANFMHSMTPKIQEQKKTPASPGTQVTENGKSDGITNSIGFSAPSPETAVTYGISELSPQDAPSVEKNQTHRVQIIIATMIGLFCLIVLILIRNLSQFHEGMDIPASMLATVSQFRDMISGCVGFLIGCPPSNVRGS